ncbi:unnamed protein product [Adineta ricciae]|uniref:Amine oxidase n=1 Tax=Adineta ricciae TaxID=249248 RepID=A0A814VVH4_ADIRI|nr:unnamed protein product [Adineta ricciae]
MQSPPPENRTDVKASRELSESLHANVNRKLIGSFTGTEKEELVKANSTEIPITTYTPVNADKTKLVIFFHGGGWTVNSRRTHQTMLNMIADATKSVWINVEYRLGPEYKFPIWWNDVLEVTKYIIENKQSYGCVDVSAKVGVAGESCGASMSAALCHTIKDLDFQILIYGIFDLHRTTPSFKEFVQPMYFLTPETLDWLESSAFRDKNDLNDSRVSVMLSHSFDGLPPCLFIVAELDPLRDDSYAYQKLLDKAGVKTNLVLVKGVLHGFFSVPVYIVAFHAIVSGHFQQRIDMSRNSKPVVNNLTRVLIIGAGLSGLEAARILEQKRIPYVLLEARNRSGGRVWSYRSRSGHMLDMGATWIHGIHGSIPSGLLTNPLWDLAREAKLPTRATQLDDVLQIFPANDNVSDVHQWFNDYIDFVREQTRGNSTNRSLGHYANVFVKKMNLNRKEQYAFYSYLNHVVENTEGAELNEIGAKSFLDLTSVYYGDELIFRDNGFMSLTNYLLKKISNIRFNQIVSKVIFHDQSVEVRTNTGQIYHAEYVLLTVPLGVLKRKLIEFSPPLPKWKTDAIDRIGFNIFEKVFLVWNSAWWNSSQFYFTRISSTPTRMNYWVNENKWNDKPALICFFSGNTTPQYLSVQNRSILVKELLETLQGMFPGSTIPQPTEVHVTNWYNDPFTYGSYSYISTQQTYDDPISLSEPVHNRLLFAGEATNIDTYGYAHGALSSARREVARLLYIYNLFSMRNQ